MFLSELQLGEEAYIAKIKGVGSFQKRLSEMGFIKGKKVRYVKSAPFNGPVQYEIMGYKVSLRKEEAELIEIIPHLIDEDIERLENFISDKKQSIDQSPDKIINVALIGNPNCGKTSIYNFASNSKEKVGNYGGVTVSSKSAIFNHQGYRLNITDLPGTYSLSDFTPEEKFVRNHLINEMPDVVINIVDASNLERNLYLTTQLIDMDIKVVLGLNMYDELTIENINFNYEACSELIGIPIVPTIGSTGEGISNLFDEVIKVYEGRGTVARHIHINYGEDLETSIKAIRAELKKVKSFGPRISGRFWALKLIENDEFTIAKLAQSDIYDDLAQITSHETTRITDKYNETPQQLITSAKYGFISGVLKETFPTKPTYKQDLAEKIDKLLLHKFFSLPIFFALMFLTFWASFNLGAYPTDWIDMGIGLLQDTLRSAISPTDFRDFFIDGLIGGAGGVLVFLPNIIILFLFISIMEDSGYMARAGFIMDKLMHKIGLHGHSFIPLMVGFGCNVPAILATRTLRSSRDRKLTMLMIPFMSCSARLPVFMLLIGAFLPKYPSLTLFGIYIFGILVAVVVAKILRMSLFKKSDAPFVLELPPYRIPTIKAVIINMWQKAVLYLEKIGKVILVASALIWILSNYPQKNTQSETKNEVKIESKINIEDTFIGRAGHTIEPILAPLGFDWKMSVSLLTGFVAKEVIVSTMVVLYHSEESDLAQSLIKNKNFNLPSALAFIVFILLYLPCVSVIVTLLKEGGLKLTLLSIFINTSLAYILGFTVYQIGILIF